MPETSPSKQEFAVALLKGLTTGIFEFSAFEQIPHAQEGVEFWGIAGQAFQVNALGSPMRQKVLDDLGTVNACSIPA
ncbi:hypothetical protein KSX_66310 [Ktedonospora formicarum]|uniref:Uncharacterized protein n=1 Tax=Ktedonospora formicarum TaxID=2778364 RepID=A0A8J3I9Z8_9CHLR|nr:hypothetical protein [Ktedonospora formicarum]GHO48468.1 hypothetical protein KSX_66310 [Ktedonospora formicarum]